MGVRAGVRAPDTCSPTKFFDFAAKFDDLFKNTIWFQHPRSDTCISYNGTAASYNKKIDGVLIQRNSRLVFDVDDGVDGRAEMRLKSLPSTLNATYSLSANAKISEDPANRIFTIGQLFGVNGAGAARPILRIEINKGNLRAAIKTKPDEAGEGQMTFAPSGTAGTVTRDEFISYTIAQKRESSNSIRLTVVLEGQTVFNQTITGVSASNGQNYFKLGCYMNQGTVNSGCTAEFDSISVTPDI